ncbi:hypothetical protein [Pseudogracilibacillus sp. SO30301A]|uniref:hypothetical protein n=1 Tax=Pseudogracilibacillus sp. SO30301A TaxID=3098291 RepID=UPI00300E07D3
MLSSIGVVGPEESVNKILKVAEQFSNTRCIPFTYKSVEELPRLIRQGSPLVDQWLFSGVMNYSYALQHCLVDAEQADFPLLHGSSFFGKLLEIQQNERRLFTSFSIDTITDKEINKVLSFYELDSLKFHSIPFSEYETAEEFATFHQRLYEQKETEVVITAIRAVYDLLKERNIPVYRLTPSYLSIKLTIELLEKKAQVKHYENLRLAVIGCKVFRVGEHIDDSIFDWKYYELNLKRSLLELAKKSSGSFVDVADGLYYIFTTKGEIDEEMEAALFNCIEIYRVDHHLDIGFAIGYGQTVYHAEQNVRYGLNQLSLNGSPTLLVVESKENVLQKTQKDSANALNTEELRRVLRKRFQDSDVNFRDVLRIALYAHKYDKQQFMVDDIAQWLEGTKRNARRILAELEHANVVEVCGKVQASTRGRPSNVYRFVDKDLFYGTGGDFDG